jgi:hypothetical protein
VRVTVGVAVTVRVATAVAVTVRVAATAVGVRAPPTVAVTCAVAVTVPPGRTVSVRTGEAVTVRVTAAVRTVGVAEGVGAAPGKPGNETLGRVVHPAVRAAKGIRTRNQRSTAFSRRGISRRRGS